jgi:hypothetical protein
MHGIKQNFELRNIEFEHYMNRESLMEAISAELKAFSSVGIGNSQTLKALKITELALDMGKTVYDKSRAYSHEDVKRIKKLALTADCFITGSNAVTENGEIINVDHSGNRVAAMTYGPERVLIIVGKNKIAENEKLGMKRVLQIATPRNAIRAGIKSACANGEACEKCDQAVRVCNYINIIRGQSVKGRMKIMMLDEVLGY